MLKVKVGISSLLILLFSIFPNSSMVENQEESIIYLDSHHRTALKNWKRKFFKVYHKYNFVYLETGIHTQKIEKLCGNAK